MANDKALRAQLAEFVDWRQAHAGFDDVVKGVPERKRGVVPEGFAHSIWEITLHIAVWEDVVRRRLEGERVDPTGAEDWPRGPSLRQTAPPCRTRSCNSPTAKSVRLSTAAPAAVVAVPGKALRLPDSPIVIPLPEVREQ